MGLRKLYQALVVRLEIDEKTWSFINIHLAAFDADGTIRKEQARQVLAFAINEQKKGHQVVVGGDWNLLLSSPKDPGTGAYQTASKDLFWLRTQENRWLEFAPKTTVIDPNGQEKRLLPAEWKLTSGSPVPSVRTLERSYDREVNFTGNIDGFVLSPSIALENTLGSSFDFESSDHNPVSILLEVIP